VASGDRKLKPVHQLYKYPATKERTLETRRKTLATSTIVPISGEKLANRGSSSLRMRWSEI
jgi:hypothetical protein